MVLKTHKKLVNGYKMGFRTKINQSVDTKGSKNVYGLDKVYTICHIHILYIAYTPTRSGHYSSSTFIKNKSIGIGEEIIFLVSLNYLKILHWKKCINSTEVFAIRIRNSLYAISR